ncbi:MAG: NOL1/NOP2/sun family putative RNA methylase [Candidatus Hydrothermarchaeales archaeon]
MYSDFLIERYKKLYDKKTLEGLDLPLEQSIRVNTCKVKEGPLLKRLEEKGVKLEKIPWVKCGHFIKKSPFSIGSTTEYLLGYYFIQDPTSMYACEVLDPKKTDLVLDMAAAPGGKTTCLSQLMENCGTVVAVELNRQRMKSLRSNVTRMGSENVIAIRKDALKVADLGLKFDKILLDAPCTGTGTVFKNPEARKKDESDIEHCTKLQWSLLEAALGVLKEGGTLVYCTCSMLPEENELLIQRAVKKFGLKLEEIPCGKEAISNVYGLDLSDDIKKARRFYPHIHRTQGFFLAKLKLG